MSGLDKMKDKDVSKTTKMIKGVISSLVFPVVMYGANAGQLKRQIERN